MSTPTATAKKTAPKRASVPANFDLSKLTPTKAAPPPVRQGAKAGPNPAVEWLQKSWDTRVKVGTKNVNGQKQDVYRGAEGGSLTVPNAAVAYVKGRLNAAATKLNIGVAIDVKTSGANSTITYVAQSRKVSHKSEKSE